MTFIPADFSLNIFFCVIFFSRIYLGICFVTCKHYIKNMVAQNTVRMRGVNYFVLKAVVHIYDNVKFEISF